MSQEMRQTELRKKTQQLLAGSLKHVRAVALAAALVPLASVAVSPAAAQDCSSGSCSPPVSVPSPCDFATSGGFILTDSGKKANFGAHGGCKNGEFWGHLNFMDHNTGYSVNSLDILGYLASSAAGPTVRDICGTATTNNALDGQPVYFRIRLVDNGEPGVADEFGIRLSTGYHVTTRILNGGQKGGGNVQLHDPNPSTTGPNPVPEEAVMCSGVAEP